MACHLLPQPWSTLKCSIVYLDSSCDLSANWNVRCIHSGLFSLPSLEAMQQLLLGKCSSITFCSWFLHWTRQKWDDVHNALLMFSLWVGQIPFVFQQVKRTLCSMYRLFSWGFIGQDMMIITLSTIIYLIYANIKVVEIIKTLFCTFSCLWQHGWVPALMSALLFGVTLYKPFFDPSFSHSRLFMYYQSLFGLQSLLSDFIQKKPSSVCSPFVFPLLAEYHQERIYGCF